MTVFALPIVSGRAAGGGEVGGAGDGKDQRLPQRQPGQAPPAQFAEQPVFRPRLGPRSYLLGGHYVTFPELVSFCWNCDMEDRDWACLPRIDTTSA